VRAGKEQSDEPASTQKNQLARLPNILREYSRTAADAAKEGLDYEAYLQRLLFAEISDREARAFQRRLKLARLPGKKTLEGFDFKALPNFEPIAVHRLAGCEFVEKRENVLFVGSSGTGKTHLATAFAIEACKAKYSVRFYTVSQLVEALLEARSEKSLGRTRALLKKIDLLVLDELGFVPLPLCIPTKKIKIPLENNHGFRLKTITFPLEKDHVLFSGRKTGFQSFKRVWRFE
jgi:DNA replication protein DnaC